MLCCALVLVSASQMDPLTRLQAFLARSEQYATRFELRTAPGAEPWSGSYRFALPRFQEYILETPGGTQRMRQNEEGLIAYEDAIRSYVPYRDFGRMMPIPPELQPAGQYALSWLPAWREKLPEGFKLQGDEVVRGEKVDRLQSVQEAEGTKVVSTVWVDTVGKLARMRTVITNAEGINDYQFDFLSWDTSNTGLKQMKLDLPIGYSPNKVPQLRRPPEAGAPVKLGNWKNARTGAGDPIEPKIGKGLVIVFTDPSCRPSGEMESALVKLAAALKPLGGTVIEVSLGSQKPDLTKKDKSRAIYTDLDGAIEKQFQPPVTPYAFLIHPGSRVRRAWASYAPDQEARFVETFVNTIKAPREEKSE